MHIITALLLFVNNNFKFFHTPLIPNIAPARKPPSVHNIDGGSFTDKNIRPDYERIFTCYIIFAFQLLLSFLFTKYLIANSTASISTTEKPSTTNTFCTNPDSRYPTTHTAATVSAYGSCVET